MSTTICCDWLASNFNGPTLSITQSILHNLGVLGRINYYGTWYENAVGAETYGGAVLVDLEANYAAVENVLVPIGVSNVLNVEPDSVTESEPDDPDFTAKIIGSPSGEYSPHGFGGAIWYAKCTYNF